MNIRGQRVNVSLEDDNFTLSNLDDPKGRSAAATSFIGDVQERLVKISATPPSPSGQSSQDGFPARRQRWTESRFKASRKDLNHTAEEKSSEHRTLPNTGNTQDNERKQIDLENRQKLASMSNAEILEERQDVLDNINPNLLQALLRRAKLEDGSDHSDFPGIGDAPKPEITATKKTSKKVTFDDTTNQTGEETGSMQASVGAPTLQGEYAATDHDREAISIESAQESLNEPPGGSIHFPRPEQPPDLDPSSPSFLEDLHKKYFPTLPADPEKLEWMKPPSTESSYAPGQAGVDAKDIRFAFDGRLLPPSKASTIPVTAGLHHHADAPDAAGYTIPELATLARSSVPSQRCVAFQTLGRLLYRLGKGEFGDPSEGSASTVGSERDSRAELARALWAEVEREKVIDIASAESNGQSVAGGRHLSAKTYATEAVWLWHQGGGRRWRTD